MLYFLSLHVCFILLYEIWKRLSVLVHFSVFGGTSCNTHLSSSARAFGISAPVQTMQGNNEHISTDIKMVALQFFFIYAQDSGETPFVHAERVYGVRIHSNWVPHEPTKCQKLMYANGNAGETQRNKWCNELVNITVVHKLHDKPANSANRLINLFNYTKSSKSYNIRYSRVSKRYGHCVQITNFSCTR